MNDVQKKVRGRPRKGQTDRQADREALIAAAVAILDAGGPGALTARAVAERAGTAVGSVYTQFDSLELLRLEANAITMRRLRDALAAALSACPSRETDARLLCLADAYLGFAAQNHPAGWRSSSGARWRRPPRSRPISRPCSGSWRGSCAMAGSSPRTRSR